MKTTHVIKSVIRIGYILLHFQNKGTHKGKYLVMFRRDYSFPSPVVDFLGHHNLYSSFAPIFIAPAGITPSYTCDFNQVKTIKFFFLEPSNRKAHKLAPTSVFSPISHIYSPIFSDIATPPQHGNTNSVLISIYKQHW